MDRDESPELPNESNKNRALLSNKGLDELASWASFQIQMLGLTEENLWEIDENGGESLAYEARIPLLVFLAISEINLLKIEVRMMAFEKILSEFRDKTKPPDGII